VFFLKKNDSAHKPTIFLHIGYNKTGTSFIQKELSDNRKKLKKLGVLYPFCCSKYKAHYELSGILGACLPSEKALYEQIDKVQAKNQLVEEIEKSKCSSIIFSSEKFIRAENLQPIKDFFDAYPLKIVVYLRRHDHWYESSYHQAIKTVVKPPWRRGFKAFYEFQKRTNAYATSYRKLIDNWADTFGKDNLIIRPYERQQNDDNLTVDLLTALGLEKAAKHIRWKNEKVNQSYSITTTNYIEIFQRCNIDPALRQKLIAYVIEQDAIKQPAQSLINPALRLHIIEENLADYAYIAGNYLGRTDNQLFYEPTPDPNELWKAPPPVYPVHAVETVLTALGITSG
jgi:hypothetical protein